MTINWIMKFLLFYLISCCCFILYSQNNHQWIGKKHNILLSNLINCNSSNEIQCMNLQWLNFSFDNHLTYGDKEIIAFIDLCNFQDKEKKVLLEFLNVPDDMPLRQIGNLLDSLENEAIKSKASPIFLGFWSVAKHSLNFWKTYKWDDDKKPPLMSIIKADALGLLKGVVLGAAFWIGSNFIFNVPDSIGIIGGSTIAVGFTALDSFRFSKKYKKRTES